MILALLAVGVLLLVLPGIPRRPPRRLPQSEWTPLATAAFIVGALAVEVALVLAATPAIASVVAEPALVDRCRGALSPLATDPSPLSWAAAALAVTFAVRALRRGARSFTRARCTRVEPWLGEHESCHGFDLVVLPTERLVAFGVPGSRRQVVISHGLVRGFEPAQVEAVIGHEAAHLRLHHSRVLVVLAAIEGAFGWVSAVGRSADTLRAGLETWADEEAGSRDDATRRSLCQALAGVVGGAGVTSDRVQRLERPARARSPFVRFITYAPVAVLVVTTGVLVSGWLTDVHHAIALGGSCMH
jgi:Zn-dependent protease with chaperone function